MKALAQFATVCLVIMATGCATTPEVSNEELIAQTVESWRTALLAHDVEGTMATFSEDFSHYEAPNKDTMHEMLAQAIDMGLGDNMAIDNNAAETEIVPEKNRATYGPIELTTVAGSLSGSLVLQKDDDGVWRIVNLEVTGY